MPYLGNERGLSRLLVKSASNNGAGLQFRPCRQDSPASSLPSRWRLPFLSREQQPPQRAYAWLWATTKPPWQDRTIKRRARIITHITIPVRTSPPTARTVLRA